MLTTGDNLYRIENKGGGNLKFNKEGENSVNFRRVRINCTRDGVESREGKMLGNSLAREGSMQEMLHFW